MVEDIKMSDKIEFEHTSKSDFQEFIDSVKAIDEKGYKEEGEDGFLDLYNEWVYMKYPCRKLKN